MLEVRAIVESLKRLYESGWLTKEQVMQRVEKGTITIDEYHYIVGDDENAVE